MPLDNTMATPARAVADIPDGASLAAGGFGLGGVPNALAERLRSGGRGIPAAAQVG
jgi:3-oxoacid CoA-transferase subunit A